MKKRQPQGLVAVGTNPNDLQMMYAAHRLIYVHHCDYCMRWCNEM